MNSTKIFKSPALMIVILSTGLMNHVLVIPLILDQAGRDAWISVLVTIPPFLLWLGVLYYIMRKTNQQSLTMLIQQHFGNLAFLLIVIPLALFLLAITIITLKDTTNWISINFLKSTPTFVIAFCIMLLCSIMARIGISSIAQMSVFLLPFVALYGFFVMLANMPHKHYSWLLPMLQNGWGPVWKGSFYSAGGLVEILFLLLFQHHIKQKVKFWNLAMIGIILIGLTFGPLLAAIAEFGPYTASKQRYPAFEQWRLVEITKYITHLDFLSLYQWLAGAVIRIAMSLYLCVDMLNFKSKRVKNGAMWVICCAVFVLVLVPITDIDFYALVKNHYIPFIIPMVILISLLLLIFSFKIQFKRG
ncbi:endospore germination permease [Neobacillus drentensis]|uniref:GerAB/ArcD/ProY family transporter n=1 Tax=Neobacillus drentensis TaxID=220684 RepID=UPI003001146A